jgi:hypothetical protein
MSLIPENDVFVFYTIKATTPMPNRFHTFLKKFRKIEQFIREYDKNHGEHNEGL